MRKEVGLALGIMALSELSHYCFSLETKEIIRKRSKDKWGKVASELTGKSDMPLECAHLDHTKNANYDNPKNGILLTINEHLLQHVMNEGRNGLTVADNQNAIHMLKKRLFKWQMEHVTTTTAKK